MAETAAAAAAPPAAPTKIGFVPKPDKAAHEKKVEAVQAQIKAHQDRLNQIRTEMDNIQNGRSGISEKMNAARALYTELNEKKKELHTERQQLKANLDRVKKDKDTFHSSQKALKSELKYEKVEDIDAEIKKLRHMQETKSMSLNEEKKIIKEIEGLQQSKKLVAKYNAEKGNADKHSSSIADIRAAMDAKSAEIAAVTEKFNAQKEVLDAIRAESDQGGRAEFPKLLQERKDIKALIDELFVQIRTLRTQFKEDNDTYFNNVRAQREAKKAAIEKEEADRKAEYEAKLALYEQEMAKIHPYQDEMDLCDALVVYLEKTYAKELRATPSTNASTKATSAVELDGLKPLKREEENFIMIGKGKGGKKNKGGNAPAKKEAAISLPLAQLEAFTTIGLMPPSVASAVGSSIAAIKDKKTWYNGQTEKPKTVEAAPAPKSPKAAAAPSSPKKQAKKGGKFNTEDTNAFPTLGSGASIAAPAWGPGAAVAAPVASPASPAKAKSPRAAPAEVEADEEEEQ